MLQMYQVMTNEVVDNVDYRLILLTNIGLAPSQIRNLIASISFISSADYENVRIIAKRITVHRTDVND